MRDVRRGMRSHPGGWPSGPGRSGAGFVAWWLAVGGALGGCVSGPPVGAGDFRDWVEGSDYSYAVYDSDQRLLHSPIERLEAEIESRRLRAALLARVGHGSAPFTAGAPAGEPARESATEPGPETAAPELEPVHPITDVFLISHGWNFTLEESAELYENYRMSFNGLSKHLQARDEGFQPYVIFVTWGSVSRPLSAALNSISPFPLPTLVELPASALDTVVFHVPSSWGETQEAFNIAVGDAARLSFYDPTSYAADRDGSEYSRRIAAGVEAARKKAFQGFRIPVSVLIDELVRLKFAQPQGERFRLHVIGHSYGGKLASLATLDACTRMNLAAVWGVGPDWLGERTLVDSLVLVSPAMQLQEMYYPLLIESNKRRALRARLTSRQVPGETRVPIVSSEVFGDVPTPEDRTGFLGAVDRVGTKVLGYSHHDSANGWLFGLSQFLLSNDALAEADVDIARRTQPYGMGWLGWLLGWPSAIGVTLAKDIAVITSQPALALLDAIRDFELTRPDRFALDLLGVPLAPLRAQYSLGNTGFPKTSTFLGSAGFALWMTPASADFLNRSLRVEAREALAFTDGFDPASQPVPASMRLQRTGLFTLWDMSAIYNGWVATWGGFAGTLANQVDVGAAHGDVRSYDRVETVTPDAPKDVTKRRRTFHWIYKVTRERGLGGVE